MSDEQQAVVSEDKRQQALEEVKAIEQKYNIAIIGIIILRSGVAVQIADFIDLPPGAVVGYAIVTNEPVLDD